MHRSAKKNSDMGDANVKVGRAGGGGAGAFQMLKVFYFYF